MDYQPLQFEIVLLKVADVAPASGGNGQQYPDGRA